MIRAAAKNFKHVTVLCSPNLYDDFILDFSKSNGNLSLDIKKKFASKSFLETSKYDSLIFRNFQNKRIR